MKRFEAENVSRHFDSIATVYDAGKDRQTYYYDYLITLYRKHVPSGSDILDVGCGTGTILNSLHPGRGVGIDLSPGMIQLARQKFPSLEFRVEDISRPSRKERFDFVMLSDVFEHLPDVEEALEGLKSYGDEKTLYITTCVNPLWAPILHAAEKAGLKLPEGDHTWISSRDLSNLLDRAGYQVERNEGRMLVPKKIPLVSDGLNALTDAWPWLRPLCLIQFITFRQKRTK